MLFFFRCVAQAIAAKGARRIVDFVPGGGFVYDVAEDVYKRIKERQRDAPLRAEVRQVAQASPQEAKKVAEQAAAEAGLSGAEAAAVVQYLTHVPEAARRSLKRPDDPSGRSVPATFALGGGDDVVRLLPLAAPRFTAGDRPAGVGGWALVELLGVGGFGEVWLARHPRFASLRSAIKFARGLTEGERSLLHEGDVISRVMAGGRHPGIVPLQDASLAGSGVP